MRIYALAFATSISIVTHNTNSSVTSSSVTIQTNATATGDPPDRRYDGVLASRSRRAQENTTGEERQPKSLGTAVDFASSALSNRVHRTYAYLRVLHENMRAPRNAIAEWAAFKPPIAAKHNEARKNRRMTALLAHTADINHANDGTSSAVESVGARQAEIKKLREIDKMTNDDGHDAISEAIRKVVEEAKVNALASKRGRLKIPPESSNLLDLRSDITRLATNPGSPPLLLDELTRYFNDDISQLATFFADASCNTANKEEVRRMQARLYWKWINQGTTIRHAAQLLNLPSEEIDLFASKNFETWLRYIAAYAKHFRVSEPHVKSIAAHAGYPQLAVTLGINYIVWRLMELIGKRKTARLIARGKVLQLAVFDVLEQAMFAQWKKDGYSPDLFFVEIEQAIGKKLTLGISEKKVFDRYETYCHL